MPPPESVLSQLEDFRQWAEGGPRAEDVTLLDYVGFVATPDSLFAFAALFFPELAVYKGRRFLRAGFSVELYEAWANKGHTEEEIQRVLNHVHISTILQHGPISDVLACEAANTISQIWQRTLGPDGLTIEAVGSRYDDLAVTFYETRPAT